MLFIPQKIVVFWVLTSFVDFSKERGILGLDHPRVDRTYHILIETTNKTFCVISESIVMIVSYLLFDEWINY